MQTMNQLLNNLGETHRQIIGEYLRQTEESEGLREETVRETADLIRRWTIYVRSLKDTVLAGEGRRTDSPDVSPFVPQTSSIAPVEHPRQVTEEDHLRYFKGRGDLPHWIRHQLPDSLILEIISSVRGQFAAPATLSDVIRLLQHMMLRARFIRCDRIEGGVILSTHYSKRDAMPVVKDLERCQFIYDLRRDQFVLIGW